MLGAREMRELLTLNLAVSRGLMTGEVAAGILKRRLDGNARQGAPDSSNLTGLPGETLAPLEAEVERLIEEAGGSAALALSNRKGLHRSIFQVLGERGPLTSPSANALAGEAGVQLRELSKERYLNFIPVGEGGMGVVYLALDSELNRLVAFKMVRSETWDGQDAATPFTHIDGHTPGPDTDVSEDYAELRARFLQEAWITGGLEHPGVVPVYELGQTTAGVPYYTMRFVGGQRTLKDALEALRNAAVEDRLTLLEPFLKLCDTVRYAHSRGVIHRDLKPENIALGEFGEVVLLDWGLAKVDGREEGPRSPWQERVQEHRESSAFKTVAGAIGTPGYMAPEAATGRQVQVGSGIDIYSLGVILFEILTGRRPLEFKNYAEYLGRIATTEAPEARTLAAEVPQALNDLCASCLSLEPRRRPIDVESISRSIRAWQTRSAIEREVDGHLRDAAAALGAAEAASGAARLTQVDRAAASLAQAGLKLPGRIEIREMQARGQRLREQGIREREKASGRRLLLRVGVLMLALVAVAGYAIAARFETKSQEKQRDLQRILRLATAKKVRDLELEVDSFSAAQADLFDLTSAWLKRADGLVGQRPAYVAALEELRRRTTSPGPPYVFESTELDWQHQILSSLVASLTALERSDRGDRKTVLGLRGVASDMTRQMSANRILWRDTIEAVAQDARLGGLRLTPQHGLLPLGRDPDSKLFEFAHLSSGPAPTRDVTTGRLVYAPDSGIVLVLIPGGTFFIGAQKDDENAPNYDALAPDFVMDDRPDGGGGREFPVQQRNLTPFLIAKHECTQAQWLHMTQDARPSFYGSGGRYPVEQISWNACKKWLGRSGLELPTETQWEYACRAGTQTTWWVGSERSEMDAVAWTAENSIGPNGENGSIMRGRTEEVGGKRANPFGLHDVHGNVWEWCFDLIQPYDEPPVDEFKYGGYRTIRGGSWYETVDGARSAFRAPDRPDYRCFHLGVRPARALTKE